MNRAVLIVALAGSGLSLAGVALLAQRVTAGPLSPPAGAVSSTYKTLSEVEPRIPISGSTNILQPGSYYLTANISGPAGAEAITISSNYVTLDLNGFAITGGQTGIRIAVTTDQGNITIQNGTIRNTTGSGIFSTPAFLGAASVPTTVRNVRLQNITDSGIYLGAFSIIENVSIAGAAGSPSSSGITLGPSSRVADSRVEGVALRGIDTGSNTQIERATVLAGAEGVKAGFSSRITNSSVLGGTTGFSLGQYASIAGCTASNTTGGGFVLDVGGTVKDCNANNTSGDAYTIGAGGTVLDSAANTILGNAFVTTGTGGVTFDRCAAFNIGLNGFQITSGSVVTNSTVSAIGVQSGFGGGVTSGVITTSNANRIEGNRFVNCGYPVFIAANSNSNSVYRNAASACSNTYTNNGALNLVGTIRTGVAASGPWDNTLQ